MSVHATGELHELIGNVARDEIKHLAILSAADRYLFGPRTWGRFRDLVRNSLDEYGGQKRKRSGGELIGTSWVTALEVVVAHLLVEMRVRRWLRSLPFITLSSVFETSPSDSSGAQQQGDERRARLDRWKLRPKWRTEELQAWEREHMNAIEDVIATKLRGFAEAEEPGSLGYRMVRRQIRWLRPRLLRRSLLDRLRDYQVRNNRYVRAHQPRLS
jgi:hypothetical protein